MGRRLLPCSCGAPTVKFASRCEVCQLAWRSKCRDCGGVAQLHRKDRLCRECYNSHMREWCSNPEYIAKRKAHYHATPIKVRRDYHLKRAHGVTTEDFDRLLKLQDGRCAICRVEAKDAPRGQFHVDHDHKTLKIRGLLCGRCNCAIGFLGDDDVARALAVVEYLSRPLAADALEWRGTHRIGNKGVGWFPRTA